MTLQVDILNPKATRLLKNLEELRLISIRKTKDNAFLKTVRKIRSKAKTNPPSFKEITKEVETVRANRYAKAKR
jgi:hypothetical protein